MSFIKSTPDVCIFIYLFCFCCLKKNWVDLKSRWWFGVGPWKWISARVGSLRGSFSAREASNELEKKLLENKLRLLMKMKRNFFAQSSRNLFIHGAMRNGLWVNFPNQELIICGVGIAQRWCLRFSLSWPRFESQPFQSFSRKLNVAEYIYRTLL